MDEFGKHRLGDVLSTLELYVANADCAIRLYIGIVPDFYDATLSVALWKIAWLCINIFALYILADSAVSFFRSFFSIFLRTFRGQDADCPCDCPPDCPLDCPADSPCDILRTSWIVPIIIRKKYGFAWKWPKNAFLSLLLFSKESCRILLVRHLKNEI